MGWLPLPSNGPVREIYAQIVGPAELENSMSSVPKQTSNLQ